MNDLPPSGVNGQELASLLKAHCLPMSVLYDRYGPPLNLLKVLTGVVPNYTSYLEIWPPAFRTCSIVVTNLLNLPASIFGLGCTPKDIVGLGMYVSSRVAQCDYCSTHMRSLALRRGVMPEKVAQALVGSDLFSPRELATINLARVLTRIPCELSNDERDAMNNCFDQAEAEWIVLGIVVTAYLNKFVDAVGVDLESSTVAKTQATMAKDGRSSKVGWNLATTFAGKSTPGPDSLWTKLSVMRHASAIVRLDNQWQQGVPDAWPAVGEFLVSLTGHDFPVLSRMQNARAIRAIASALKENLNPETTVIGLSTKSLAGIVFCEVIADEGLSKEIRVVGLHAGVTYEQMDAVGSFASNTGTELPIVDGKACALLLLARSASSNPADISPDVISVCRDSELPAAAIVELVNWLSLLQMLHRLSSYYTAGSTIQIVNFLRLADQDSGLVTR